VKCIIVRRLEHCAIDNRLSKINAMADAISSGGTLLFESLARVERRGDMEIKLEISAMIM
jgi:hypothetical protein